MTRTAAVLTADERETVAQHLWDLLAEVDPKMFASLWRAAHATDRAGCGR